eukprot:gnl/MRDRNA2_/MRDRNA2_128521_c0_seq1.p1 gnl/MRDRNA2_/MRDRNA2_128521_c0~~gnl/MRDRNA2_/MRDRNA2_128521_c0_seq1.p1  ORF type:complete len:359 (+),score=71.05 gnl/MRDRNA2_/MRDRNA2_128521_c0_seq1:105-1079(+)
MEGDFATVPLAITLTAGYDFASYMDHPLCEHYNSVYSDLKTECMNIYNQAVQLKKAEVVLMGSGGTCAGPDGSDLCTQDFLNGSDGLCSQVLQVKKKLGRLASTEQNHSDKILQTAEASGKLGYRHRWMGICGGSASTVLAITCVASFATMNPILWALCAASVTGGLSGAYTNARSSRQFYQDQTELNTLDQECASYMHDIEKMRMAVYHEYANICIEGRGLELVELDVEDPEQGRPYEDTAEFENIQGHLMYDSAVETKSQDAMVWMYASAVSFCFMAIMFACVSWRQMQRSAVAVDQEALLCNFLQCDDNSTRFDVSRKESA